MNKHLQVLIDAAASWRDELGAYVIPASEQFGDTDSADIQRAEHDDIDKAIAFFETRDERGVREFNEAPEYFAALGIAARWQDCKCQGKGWCELHDHFNPEDDSYC